MDEVERITEDPVCLAVIDEEFTVRGYLSRLDGTQISAENTRGWMLISEFNGPDTSSASYVKDILHVFWYRRSVEFPI
jgi:hypothetical protein